MATTETILGYNAANSIDPANDYILEYQNAAGAYMRINRNVLLGVAGTPADISTSQSISNKTLTNTNTVTLKDSLFTLQNATDTTKQAQFSLTGITTATTRTYTLPNASSTLADISTTQTLTNKTLTSPTITGGSIDNSTITVDSIAGHTTSTLVSVAGLSISNGVLNTNNSVITTNITDSAVTPNKLFAGSGSSWPWQTYTPTWTNVTIGNATVSVYYSQTGKTVTVNLNVTLGNTSSVSGLITFSLPVTAAPRYSGGGVGQSLLGVAYIENAGVAGYTGFIRVTSTTTASLRIAGTAGTYLGNDATSASAPFTFTTGSFFNATFTYEAA